MCGGDCMGGDILNIITVLDYSWLKVTETIQNHLKWGYNKCMLKKDSKIRDFKQSMDQNWVKLQQTIVGQVN